MDPRRPRAPDQPSGQRLAGGLRTGVDDEDLHRLCDEPQDVFYLGSCHLPIGHDLEDLVEAFARCVAWQTPLPEYVM